MEKTTDRVVPVCITMPPTLARNLRVMAAMRDKSRSKFVVEVLEQALPSVAQHNGEGQRQGHEQMQAGSV